jgi:hypothetical protein
MKVNGARCNRETEAYTFLACSALLNTEKGLKDRLKLVIGDTRPTILHSYRRFATAFMHTELHANRRSWLSELNRITNNVFTGAPKSVCIGRPQENPGIEVGGDTLQQ